MRAQYLHENMGALKVTLSEEDVAQVRKLVNEADQVLEGNRYPPGHMEMLFQETPELK
jgi:diketogulonate reductase-like aldo/keto reductase